MDIPPSLAGPLRFSTKIPLKYMEGGRINTGYPTITLNDSVANSRADFPPNTLYTTKYTVWSFIPKVLYEQFRKATSFYFLFIAILVSIPSVSPLNPATSWAGLIFILGVAAIKEAYEDYLRTVADNKVNSLKFTKIDPSTGLEKSICSHQIMVGDILLVRQNSRIPCDMVLLKTSLEDGTCFIETAQLDGETNLKIRYSANQHTYEMTQGDICRLSGSLEADLPNSNLYSFKGSLRCSSSAQHFSLDEKNLCLSGSIIRNTEYIIGIVVYAGVETKLGLNLKLPPSKFSSLDHKLNKYIAVIFGIKMFLVIVLTIINITFEQSDFAIQQELLLPGKNAIERGIIAFTTYFALLNSLIPLSLVVTLEIVRFVQSTFMEWDETFFHDDKEATATTSNLNDQLALVDFIFSDKTGTLTENIMTFKKASINGNVIDDSNNEGRLLQIIQNPVDKTTKFYTAKFLKTLALAHSCQPDENQYGKVVYKSASPDEEALCDAARVNGYVFKGRQGPNVVIIVRGVEKTYQLLTEIEFSSERRRMSIIVRTPKNKIILFSKGADVEMQKRIAYDQMNQNKLDVTNKDLYLFSTQGLRTLILGYKVLSPEDYEQFRERYNYASNMIDGREFEVAKVCDAMERDLQLIGATAIEDKLQLGVPKTIHNLRRAGIKIWLITGDKDETAVNIGYSSNLLSQDMGVEFLTGTTSEEVKSQLNQTALKYLNGAKKKPFAIVVNGASLSHIIRDFSSNFVEVAQHCVSVICARVTPLQKAEVVKMVQDAQPDSCCLAIGDGGNDVSMIQQAQIGIGIKGREGGQAARASDFSIPQFRHLQRLLFIHGRYSLLRNTKVIYMSFYKNIAVFLCNAYFGLFNGASGQTLFDDWLTVFFNIVFTSLPVFMVGLFERDLHEPIIDRNPPIYRSQKKLTFLGLLEWVGFAIIHSALVFGTCYLLLGQHDVAAPQGVTNGFEYFGVFTISLGLEVVLCKFLLETFDWSVATLFGHTASILAFILAVMIEGYIYSVQFYVPGYVYASNTFWAAFFLMPALCLLPDFTLKFISRQFRPKAWHILQEKYLQKKSDRRYSSLGRDTGDRETLGVSLVELEERDRGVTERSETMDHLTLDQDI